MIRRVTPRRRGLTLLEVLVALAIFLLSLAAITRLVTFAGQRALDARRVDEGGRLARSKMGEILAGAVPLQGSDDQPFDEDPDYTWSMTADSASMSGLWVVTVTIKHKGDSGPDFTLRQYVLDPSLRGSSQDTVTVTGSANQSSGGGASSPSGGSSKSSQGDSAGAMGGGAMPAGNRSQSSKGSSGGNQTGSRGNQTGSGGNQTGSGGNQAGSGGRTGSTGGGNSASPSPGPSGPSSPKR